MDEINKLFKTYNHKYILLDTLMFNNQNLRLLNEKYGFASYGLLFYLLLKLNYCNNKLNLDLLIRTDNLSKEQLILIRSYVAEGLLYFNEKAGGILFSKELMLNNYNYKIKKAEEKIIILNQNKKGGYFKLATFEEAFDQYYEVGDFNIVQEYIYNSYKD